MSEEKIPYLCNPKMNNSCPKSMCHLIGGPCYHTLNEQYAIKDENEQPIVADWWPGGSTINDKIQNNCSTDKCEFEKQLNEFSAQHTAVTVVSFNTSLTPVVNKKTVTVFTALVSYLDPKDCF